MFAEISQFYFTINNTRYNNEKRKKYIEAAKLVDRTKVYNASGLLELSTKTSTAKFDERVKVHVKLGVDSRHADQHVCGAIVLPHRTGKTQRVLVFAKGVKAAGADYVGGEELIPKI